MVHPHMLKLSYMMEEIKESNAMKMSHSLLLFALAHCLSNCTVGQVQLPNIYFSIPTYCLSTIFVY